MSEHKKIWTLNESNFMEAYEAEIKMINGTPLTIDIDPITLLSIIGTLQLGLKHPEHQGPTAKIVRDFINLVSNAFFRNLPACSAVIKKGFEIGDQKPVLNEEVLMNWFLANGIEFNSEQYLLEFLKGFQLPANDSTDQVDPIEDLDLQAE